MNHYGLLCQLLLGTGSFSLHIINQQRMPSLVEVRCLLKETCNTVVVPASGAVAEQPALVAAAHAAARNEEDPSCNIRGMSKRIRFAALHVASLSKRQDATRSNKSRDDDTIV